jgi:hypothetical protein
LEYVAIIILLALFQYLWFSVRVGAARPKYGVNAPSTSGNETWERLYRVQQNTLEQLVVFLPALVLFGLYLSARWALLPGLLYLIGRQLYSHEYIKKPESRGPGMGLTLLASAALLIGAGVGIVMKIG